jgi:hypothetical protein
MKIEINIKHNLDDMQAKKVLAVLLHIADRIDNDFFGKTILTFQNGIPCNTNDSVSNSSEDLVKKYKL